MDPAEFVIKREPVIARQQLKSQINVDEIEIAVEEVKIDECEDEERDRVWSDEVEEVPFENAVSILKVAPTSCRKRASLNKRKTENVDIFLENDKEEEKAIIERLSRRRSLPLSSEAPADSA